MSHTTTHRHRCGLPDGILRNDLRRLGVCFGSAVQASTVSFLIHEALKIIGGTRLAAGGVARVRHELKRHVVKAAPAHAALDAVAAEAGIGEKHDAQAPLKDGLERLMCAGAGSRGDDAVVLLGQDLALVVGEDVGDDGVGHGHAKAALHLVVQKRLVRPPVIVLARIVVKVEKRGRVGSGAGDNTLTADIGKKHGRVFGEHGDERR